MHVQENEADAAKRAFTRSELQTFFTYCADQVARIRGLGRKGWLPAFRDATLFKTAYPLLTIRLHGRGAAGQGLRQAPMLSSDSRRSASR